METPIHSMSSLFEQLGLDNTEDGINLFIEKNGPLAKGEELHLASFWNTSQADFLQQAVDKDADWAETVNQLDVRLR